ncbi:MAG: xanthine dehydrogenase family protein molybdopterin-binding subunit [Trueperaceae bacterium]|nr:xanthine dehydrogenase family protein molybdopterin-binding subunit [Trueperaceae bacterium]
MASASIDKPDTKYLGKPRKIIDGLEKVVGRARYVADVVVPGLLHLRPVLSTVAHAKIISVDKSEALKIPGVVAVLTAQDLVTRDRTITSRSDAILAKDRVLFVGQPVVAVVAETEAAAEDGAEAVIVEYEELPVNTSIEAASAPDAHVTWPEGLPKGDLEVISHAEVEEKEEVESGPITNHYKTSNFKRGDVEAGFAEADAVVENHFRVGSQYQGYMETHGCVVEPDAVKGGLTIYTTTQAQFGVRNKVADILKLKRSNVKVTAMTVGGGFGSKYGTIEPLAATVAYTLNRPVKLILQRGEDLKTTTPAPATQIKIKLGAKKDGSITALQADIILDAGAFAFDFGQLTGLLLGSNYKYPNLDIEVNEYITNKTEMGAYRAPGAYQSTFAVESTIDDLARKLGLDPVAFRMQNLSETDDPMANGAPWPSLNIKACLERMAEHPLWLDQPKAEGEGIGFAVSAWPCALSPSASTCRIDGDGTVKVVVGSTDISGVSSSMVLIAAEVLGVSPSEVELIQGNTDVGPFAPGSGGSQVTYSLSGAVAAAAEDVKVKLLELAADQLEARVEDVELINGAAQVKGVPSSAIKIGKLAQIAESSRSSPGPLIGEGRSSIKQNAPGAVAHMVKVKVDKDTGHVQVLDYVAVQDVGYAINPMLVEGQIHGGVVQGIGLGLFENHVYDDYGQLQSGSFMDYALPRSVDVPNIEAIQLNLPSPQGPFGARGVGEPPITAGAAAIGNAIRDAVGVRVTEMPMRPPVVWKAIHEQDK